MRGNAPRRLKKLLPSDTVEEDIQKQIILKAPEEFDAHSLEQARESS
jgi:hypothetical protein